MIIAGNGVHASRAWSELAALAELLAIPVATTATGKSAMAEVHPLALGVFGNWGQAVANEVVSTADTVLVVGSRLAPTDTCFENPELLDADRQTFLQIDVEPLNVGPALPGGGGHRGRRPRGAGGALVDRAPAAAHAGAARGGAPAARAPRRAQDPAPLLRRAGAALGRRAAPARARDHRAGPAPRRARARHHGRRRQPALHDALLPEPRRRHRLPAVVHRRHGLRAARGHGRPSSPPPSATASRCAATAASP